MNKALNLKTILNLCMLAGMLCLSTSCRDEADDVILPGSYPEEYTFTSQFEAIWHGINHNYVFWEIDPTDWDETYTRYRPVFEELDKQETVSTADLESLYEEICGPLIDHHMGIKVLNLKAGPDEERKFAFIHPGSLEVNRREDAHPRVSCGTYRECRDKMKEAGRISHDREFVDEDSQMNLEYMFTYVIDGDILYLKPSSFYVIDAINKANDPDNEAAQAAFEVYEEYVGNLLFNRDIDGVILDLRCNGGGMLLDMFTLLGPLLKEDTHVLDTKTKMGVGRLDYGEWVPYYVEAINQRQLGQIVKWEDDLPETDCIGDRQLVVLVDCHSVSMSEMTTLGAKTLPYATIIGERTFGGTGPLTSNTHISFSGQFGDSNLQQTTYWVYTSTWMSRTPDGTCFEGTGVTPDITVPLDSDKLINEHTDNQLEYAIDHLHGK